MVLYMRAAAVLATVALGLFLLLPACTQDKASTAPAPSTEDLVAQAAMQRFGLAPAQRDQAEVFLVGAKEAAIARDQRTGICLVLSKTADARWEAHGMFKGTPGAQDLSPPLTTAGSLQEGVTRDDLKRVAAEHCR